MDEQKRCPFCGELILTVAIKCKHCGEFLDGSQAANQKREPSNRVAQEPEKTIWTGNPSHYNELGGYFIGILLAPLFGLGLLFILLILIGRKKTVYTVTTKRVMTRTGILSQSTREVSTKDICSIHLHQGVFERVLNLGTVKIGSVASEVKDIQFFGIKDAPKVRDLIAKYRQ